MLCDPVENEQVGGAKGDMFACLRLAFTLLLL